MQGKKNSSKGSYTVSRSKAGKHYKVEVVGFSRKLINGFKEDMKEIYEEEHEAKRNTKTGANRVDGPTSDN